MIDYSHSMSDGSAMTHLQPTLRPANAAASFVMTKRCQDASWPLCMSMTVMPSFLHLQLSATTAFAHLSLEVIAKFQRALLSIYADEVGLITEV